uniref:RNMT-activating mini protein n=1 Tax=Anopheles culicifacies TaxID=139723 RepID=A0A182LVE2_9DIPT
MVDPKRHINVLSQEEQVFLEECEKEFAHRFTDLDEEFMAHCQREQKPPPVVHPWNGRRNGGEGRGGRGRGGGGWRGERRFNDRQGGHAPFHSRDGNYRPYNHRRNESYRSGRGDSYHASGNHHSSRSNHNAPYERSGDRHHKQ